jgi:hypothetical protein
MSQACYHTTGWARKTFDFLEPEKRGEAERETVSVLYLFVAEHYAVTARVLMLMVIPGHIVFVYTIKYFKEGTASPTKLFVTSYLTAAFVQVRKAVA